MPSSAFAEHQGPGLSQTLASYRQNFCMPTARSGVLFSTSCSENGPWMTPSMTSLMAAWRYTHCSCSAPKPPSRHRRRNPSSEPPDSTKPSRPGKRGKVKAKAIPATTGRHRIKAKQSAADSKTDRASQIMTSLRMYAQLKAASTRSFAASSQSHMKQSGGRSGCPSGQCAPAGNTQHGQF